MGMPMESVSTVVIGGGVVGLACAHQLSHGSDRNVIVIERHSRLGQETSSRNSGVIHAGLHYPKTSLKTRLCIRGRKLLYQWCIDHDVPHVRTGKLIVATDEQESRRLRSLAEHAAAAGVKDLTLLSREDVRKREPAIRCHQALHVACSGIVDVHEFLQSLASSIRKNDGDLVMNTTVKSIERDPKNWIVHTIDTLGRQSEIRCDELINAAGLRASDVATLAGTDILDHQWQTRYCKGSYFTVRASVAPPTVSLLYPMKGKAGLGVHLTRDLSGQCRAGPDTEWIDKVDYDVDPSCSAKFATAIARYLPDINEGDLSPDYAGVRPKLVGPGQPPGDFIIAGQTEHGQPGLIHLLGIESPGLTAALAIAERVSELLSA